jgi:hypothetical protein
VLKKSTLLIILAVLLLAFTACAPAAEEPPVQPTPEETATAVPPLQEGTSLPHDVIRVPEDPNAKGYVTVAVNDLAARLDIPREQIEVVAYEPVTWNDGSLGCPQPDMMYTQALVDGYVIQLRAGGQTYTYNGATGSDPFLCER